MTAWLDPLRAALSLAPEPVEFFVRDDDAGWGDRELLALLDTFDGHDVPIDLAVIPSALHPALARELLSRAGSGPVGLHQHGFSHVNHERAGRKCEFGPSRSAAEQLRDIRDGRERLRDLLGDVPDPFFTPPWNRCTSDTADALAELGFAALSRDSGASPLGDLPVIAERPVHLDWLKGRQKRRSTADELGRALAAAAHERSVVGVMLHHAEMNEAEREGVGALLAAVAGHPNARWTRMADVIRGARQREGSTA
jgi:peptidoglycan/xylan/chitin deacetylase (PgdA/CDA1 family)